MKFIYIEKTLDAPQRINLLGYDFVLNGDAVEVSNPIAISKMENMAHVGIVNLKDVGNVNIVKDKPVVKKKVFKDCFLELSVNATKKHIISVVNSKTADYLVEYVNHFKLEVSKEDKLKIKDVKLTKSTLSKYVLKDLEARFKDSKEEKKEEKKEDSLDDKIVELVNSKTYNELLSFMKAKEIEVVDTKKDTLKAAITQYLKENGTN